MNEKLAVQSPGLAYRLLSIPLYLFWILHGVKHGAKHGLPGYLSMRLFGFAGDGGGDRVWVHASSVGEVRAVSPLVQALVRQGEAVLFTSFTATGYQAIRHQFSDAVTSGVIPLDSIWNCRGFFRRHRIKLGLVMETELWPELLYQARRQQVELILVNARLSRKSLDAGGFVRGLLTRSLGYFRLILTRNQRDLEALLSLGASAQRTTIIGNLKTHIESGQQHSRLIERDYLILASSHSGEEQQFLEARPAQLADRLLVLAPRHPERGAAIEIQLENLGLRFAVRSKAQAIGDDTEVYLADTLGELGSLLAYARVVIMGGSFNSTGGHNLIEPANLGCAIITGPSDSNIVEDIDMLGAGSGVLQVENMAACWREITRLLENPEQAEALGREAQSRLAQQPNIVQDYLAAIKPYL
jgi:3-deoxy-D-manno-octulosonic-acid transferase